SHLRKFLAANVMRRTVVSIEKPCLRGDERTRADGYNAVTRANDIAEPFHDLRLIVLIELRCFAVARSRRHYLIDITADYDQGATRKGGWQGFDRGDRQADGCGDRSRWAYIVHIKSNARLLSVGPA